MPAPGRSREPGAHESSPDRARLLLDQFLALTGPAAKQLKRRRVGRRGQRRDDHRKESVASALTPPPVRAPAPAARGGSPRSFSPQAPIKSRPIGPAVGRNVGRWFLLPFLLEFHAALVLG